MSNNITNADMIDYHTGEWIELFGGNEICDDLREVADHMRDEAKVDARRMKIILKQCEKLDFAAGKIYKVGICEWQGDLVSRAARNIRRLAGGFVKETEEEK